MSVLTRHFQKITKIVFALNDQYLITSSEDGFILVWDFHEYASIIYTYFFLHINKFLLLLKLFNSKN
jgi:WD40 repeat protein